MKSNEIDILDVLIILAKHKKFIFWTTLIVSVAAIVFSLVTPEIWTSTATILPSGDSGYSSAFNGSVLDLGSAFMGGNNQNSAISLVAIMKSRTFSEDIIRKFELIDYFEITDPDSLVSMELAVRKLKAGMLDIQISEETGFIYISVETKDKKFSADIANYYFTKLEEYNQNSRITKGRQKRIFLENRINEIEKNIHNLSEELREFQNKNNAIDLTEQTKAVLGLYSELIAQKKQAEIKLEISEFSMPDNSPVNESLQKEIEILNYKIKETERNEKESQIKYGLNLDDISDLIIEYAEIQMQIKIEQTVYEFMYPQYEQARLDELKDLPTIEIIDIAGLAGLRSKPRRALICILAFLSALIFSSVIAILVEFLKHEKEKVQVLIGELKK